MKELLLAHPYDRADWNRAATARRPRWQDDSLVFLAPYSFLGSFYGPMIKSHCSNVVAVVDDQWQSETIHDLPRWSSQDLRRKFKEVPGLIGVDMTFSDAGHAVFSALSREIGLPTVDLLSFIDVFDLPAVYQPPREMRERTCARFDEWVQLRGSLADEASRSTLDRVLSLRLTLDRDQVRKVALPLSQEYFSSDGECKTFSLRDDEIVADCGAYVGSTVRRVIAATDGRFRAIHAFEPDRKSFAELEKLRALRMPGIVLHNAAVGDTNGSIRFLETGTMGSHVDEAAGNSGDTPIVRLDDVMDEVTFIKMDLEGYEQKALRGGARLIRECRPRMAITAYHYADDLLDLWKLFEELAPDYDLRLRHHSSYYYDTIFYASPRERARSA